MEIESIKKLLKNVNIKRRIDLYEACEAERYFKGDNDILYPTKVPKPWLESSSARGSDFDLGVRETEETTNVVDNKSVEKNPLRDADNRIASHFYNFLVEQKATYLFGNPVTFDAKSKTINETIEKQLGGHWRKLCKNLCINASNCKVGWVHHWLDENNEYHYGIVDSKQVYAFWGGKVSQELLLLVRTYDYIDEIEGQEFEVVEIWDEEKCMAYQQEKNGAFVDLKPYNCFTFYNVDIQDLEESNIYYHGFSKVPFSAFFNNQFHINDLKPIKGYIDSYDKVYSLFTDNLEDVQQTIFIFENLGGASLQQMMQSLKENKAMKVISNERIHTDVRTLIVEIPTQAADDLLSLARKNIFEQGQGVDPSPENYAGNTSGEALKYMYANLEQKCAATKDEFEVGFEHFITMMVEGLHLNVDPHDIDIIWGEPTRINNESEAIENVRNSDGIVSKRTLLSKHPFVESVDDELEQIKKEDEEKEQVYPLNFGNRDNAVEEQNDEEQNETDETKR